jgi:hypothetical protein
MELTQWPFSASRSHSLTAGSGPGHRQAAPLVESSPAGLSQPSAGFEIAMFLCHLLRYGSCFVLTLISLFLVVSAVLGLTLVPLSGCSLLLGFLVGTGRPQPQCLSVLVTWQLVSTSQKGTGWGV